MKSFILLTLFILSLIPVHAQVSDDSASFRYRNSLSFIAMGVGEMYTMSYNRILTENKRGIIVGNMLYSPSSDFNEGKHIFTLGLSLSEYFGKGNHHWVMGLGYFVQKREFNNEYNTALNTLNSFITFPNLEIGYAFWNPQKHSVLKVITYFRYLADFENDTYSMLVLPGVSYSYCFNLRQPKVKINNEQTDKSFTRIAIGYEINSGFGNTMLDHTGERTGLSLNNNFYFKYYISRLYIKAIAGISYLAYNELHKSDTSFRIYRSNPLFYSLGMGAGIKVFDGDKYKIETGIDIANIFSKNKLMNEPVTNFGYERSDRANYELPSFDYEPISQYRPFMISPELLFQRIINNKTSIYLCFRYTWNYYQFAGIRFYDEYVLQNKEINLGFGIQYNISD